MSLARTTAIQTLFSFIQQIQMFVFGTIVNIIIINALPRDEYGLIGLATGYYVILTWFAISPANILSQRYRLLRGQFSDYLPKIYTFTFITISILLLVGVLVSSGVYNATHSFYAALIFLVYTASQLIMLLSNLAQYILKLEFQQQKITKLIGIIRTAEILLLGVVFFFPYAYVVISITALVALAEAIAFTKLVKNIERFNVLAPILPTLNTIWEHIKSYSLWHHLGTNLIRYMYEIDAVFLGFWASLSVVGDYAIAMKMANFSFIIPSIIQANAGILFTRLDSPDKQNRAASLFIKYCTLLAIVQLILFIFLGKFYIGLHTKVHVQEIYTYSVLIFIGTTVLNVARPLISYINAYSSMKSFFLRSVLPAGIFTTLVYPFSAYLFGPVGLAVGNIVCYTFWMVTILLYVRRTSFRFKLILFDHDEKQILNSLINKARIWRGNNL